jgi:rhodanese-related sulfurtransferase
MHKGTALILIILIVIAIVYYTQISMDQYINKSPSLRISVEEAKAKRFGLIVDVRTPKERATLGFYPLSIPISIQSLRAELPLDISNKQTPILVYSNGDSRAAEAAALIYQMGYPRVSYIDETYLSMMPGSQ